MTASFNEPVWPADREQPADAEQRPLVAQRQPFGVAPPTYAMSNHGVGIQAHSIYGGVIVQYNKGAPRIRIVPEEIGEVIGTYVAPALYEEALTALHDTHLVVVVDCPGHRWTALRLLAALSESIQYRRLDLWEFDQTWETPQLDDLPVELHQGYLLDLQSSEIDQPRDKFLRGLASHAERLRDAGSYLVITITEELWRASGRLAERFLAVMRPGYPDPHQVALRHLQWPAPSERVPRLGDDAIAGLLTRRTPPAEAARLASLVRESGDEDDWRDRVIDQYTRWQTHLDTWFEENSAAHDRALLITTAALEGASTRSVTVAANALRKKLDTSSPDGSALDGPGLRAQLKAVGARVEDGIVQLSEARATYDEAVLDYVWAEFPSIRQQLLDWLASLSTVKDPDVSLVGDRPARLLTGLIIRQRDTTFLLSVAKDWAQRDRALAIRVLEHTAQSRELGKVVRHRLYLWAKTSSSVDLLQAIAEVCPQLWQDFPNVVLTRLRHLAARPEPEVAEVVIGTITAITTTGRFLDQLLAEIIAWTTHDDRARRETGCRAFVHLIQDRADGHPAMFMPTAAETADRKRVELLVRGWRSALVLEETKAQAKAAVGAWLEHGVRGTADPVMVLGLMAGVARASSSHVVALIRAGLSWQSSWNPNDETGQIDRQAFFRSFECAVVQEDRLMAGISDAAHDADEPPSQEQLRGA